MSFRKHEHDARRRRRALAAARSARLSEKRRKEAERQQRAEEERRHELRVQRLVEEAVVKTESANHRTQKLNFLLLASLPHLPDVLDFDKLRERVPTLDLGDDAEPLPKPEWEAFAPKPASLGDRLFRRGSQYQRALEEAQRAFQKAQERYRTEEVARQQRVERRRREYEASIATSHQRILEHNAKIDEFEARVYEGERKAVSEYYERVFAPLVDKPPFPKGRRFAYVPESRLLLIEWDLPSIDIVPREKEFRYDKATDQVVYRRRSLGEIRETYQNLLAQLALRAAKAAFRADPNTLVDTVVFNGILSAGVYDEDEENDLIVEVEETICLISLRATRHHFHRLDLKEVDPLDVVRRRFSAELSLYPDGLVGIEPYLPYELADPNLELDREGPNLHTASPQVLERVVTELLQRMGRGVKLLRAKGSDLDFLAARTEPGGRQELHVVHVRQIGTLATLGDVRALYQDVRREKADAGTLLITGGFESRSYEYANGKPLHLLDGYGLVALCKKYGLQVHLDQNETDVDGEDGFAGDPSDGNDDPESALPHQRLPILPLPLRIGR